MNIPPVKAWFKHQESHGLNTITYYLPQHSAVHLDILKTYWTNPWADLAIARLHAWGGNVKHRYDASIEKRLFFKRFSIKNPRYLHKPARARATVVTELHLNEQGFNTASLVGLIEKRVAGILVDSAVISEELVGATPAYRLFNPIENQPALTDTQRNALVIAIGQCVGDWHNTGLFHGDMHMGNIMCAVDDEEKVIIYWIDNEEGRAYTEIPASKRLDDLEHLARFTHHLKTSDLRLFWETYVDTCEMDAEVAKRLAHTLRQKTIWYQRKKRINYSFD